MEENMNDMHGEETPRTDLTLFSEKMQELKSRIASVIVGQERTVDLVLTAILANGHVLIEGVPGVAKTLLARLTARLIDADFSRVQFTPDLMPSDVLGTTVFNMKTNEFDFHRGPVFANIIFIGFHIENSRTRQNAVRSFRSHGRTSGQYRRNNLPDGRTIYHSGNPESGGAGGNL